MPDHFWEVITIAVAAQFAILKYLDQKRRESAERRYLDNCLDPLVADLTRAVVTEIDKVTAAKRLLYLAADGKCTKDAIAAARVELQASKSIFGPAYFRLPSLVRDASFFKSLGRSMQLINSNDSFLGERFLGIAEELSQLPDVASRLRTTKAAVAVMEKQADCLSVVASTLPFLINELAHEFSVAIYSDFGFDFDGAQKAVAAKLRDVNTNLELMNQTLDASVSDVRDAIQKLSSA